MPTTPQPTNQPSSQDLTLFISKRINSLGWSITHAAHRASIAPSELSKYLNGNKDIQARQLWKLLLTLGVEIGWKHAVKAGNDLSGTWPTFERPITPEMKARAKAIDAVASDFEKRMKKADINQYQLSKQSGVHTSLISRLLTRRSMPSDAMLEKMNKVLDTER